jgi:divalent metal cation (Fe/Co/Zn/Cd) transporter
MASSSSAPTPEAVSRALARAKTLEYFTLAWNSLEAIVSLLAAIPTGSVALLGFGFDSLIETTSGGTLLWRLHRGERTEAAALRIVGACFLALALYVAVTSVRVLWTRSEPGESVAGIVITAAAVVVMPLLARAKRRAAATLASSALRADARQADFCMYLSAITLAGLALHALLGWWWADPAAALVMVPIIAREGISALRGQQCACSGGCH